MAKYRLDGDVGDQEQAASYFLKAIEVDKQFGNDSRLPELRIADLD